MIQYDYVAYMETLQPGLDEILPHLNATDLRDDFHKSNANEKYSSGYLDLYHTIPLSVLQPVLDKYKVNADMFGYTFDEYRKRNVSVTRNRTERRTSPDNATENLQILIQNLIRNNKTKGISAGLKEHEAYLPDTESNTKQ